MAAASPKRKSEKLFAALPGLRSLISQTWKVRPDSDVLLAFFLASTPIVTQSTCAVAAVAPRKCCGRSAILRTANCLAMLLTSSRLSLRVAGLTRIPECGSTDMSS